MTTLETVLASAAVGALVSSGLTLTGQALERRARHRELALSTAVQLATTWTETVLKLYTTPQGYVGPALGEPSMFLATYFRSVKHVLKTGDLPEEPKPTPTKGS